MTFVKQGVVLPLGAGGAFDDARGYLPAPLLLEGRVLLYYVGFDGAKYRVGLACSEDGIHFVKQGVVLPLGADEDFDDTHGYAPGPLLLGGRILLYYAASDGAKYRVGLACSEDGIHFTKLGVVLPLGSGGDFDDGDVRYCAPLLLDGRVLLYCGASDGSKYRVGLACSEDGIHFTKLGVVVPLGSAGEFDTDHVYGPAPLLLDGRVLLYYSGYDGSVWRTGLACSEDGIHFTKQGVIFPVGDGGDFDDGDAFFADALLLDGQVRLYYTGYDGSDWRVGLAVSESGF